MKQENKICRNCIHYFQPNCLAAPVHIFIHKPSEETCRSFRNKDENRGGARPGAGRKAKDPEDKRVQMIVTIGKETREKLQAISKARKMKPGRIIDEMVKGEW